jgi:hypothetical protein
MTIIGLINKKTNSEYDIDKLSNKLFVIDKNKELVRIGWEKNDKPENN